MLNSSGQKIIILEMSRIKFGIGLVTLLQTAIVSGTSNPLGKVISESLTKIGGLASFAILTDLYNTTCNGVVLTKNRILTTGSCHSDEFSNEEILAVEKVHFPFNPEFNMKVKFGRSKSASFSLGMTRFEIYFREFNYRSTSPQSAPIPAVPAPLLSESSRGPELKCIFLGYSGSKGEDNEEIRRLTTRPASITDYNTCKKFYPDIQESTRSLFFCAKVDHVQGLYAECNNTDEATTLFCQEPNTETGSGKSNKESQEVAKESLWLLTGMQAVSAGCSNSDNPPILYIYVRKLVTQFVHLL